MTVFLNKVPAVKTPKPVIFGAAIVIGAFYFWYTKPQQSTANPIPSPKSPETAP